MKLSVIGLGIGDPPAVLPAAFSEAQVLVGGRRQLGAFPDHPAERIVIAGPLPAVFARIREKLAEGKAVAVLADGDPLFFGIGARLIEEFGPENVAVHPGVTAVAAAAARLSIPWHDTPAVSLHGRSDYAPLFAALMRHRRVAVYTDATNTPATVGRALLDRGADMASLWVLEDLGLPGERVRRLSPAEAAGQEFSGLNLVLAEVEEPPLVPLGLGLPDELYEREGGLITKWPVRAAGLAALRLTPDATVWDLGSGCGSVAIEASLLVPRGRVVAVERNPSRAAMIRANIRRTHAWAVEVIEGKAPVCLIGLPGPDRIFIGGGIGRDSEVLRAACGLLAPGGRIVVHAILLDSLARTRAHLAELGWPTTVTQVQVSRSEPLAGDVRLAAWSPVFIIAADKPAV